MSLTSRLAAWLSASPSHALRSLSVVLTCSAVLVACAAPPDTVSDPTEPKLSSPTVASSSQALFSTPKPVAEYELAGCLGYGVTNTLFGSKLSTIDLRNQSSKAMGTAYLTYNLTGLAADPKTRKLYAVDATTLYQLDPASGQVTRIGTVNLLLGLLRGLEFGRDGQLYSWSTLGGLTRIDKTNGRGSKVFGSPLPSLFSVDTFAFNADGSKVYVAKNDRLYSVNALTGDATLLPGRLPVLVSALYTRDDGRLLLVPKQAVARGYELLLFDPTVGVWSTVTTYGVVPETQLSCGGFNGFTWLRTCGNPTSGGQAPLIQSVALSATTACAGDSIDVAVSAFHPERKSEPAQVTINALPGSVHRVQLSRPGNAEILIFAQTADGYVDSRKAQVTVQDCNRALQPPELRITNNSLVRDGADLTILNRGDYSQDATYAWTFGDGTNSTTRVPHAQHSYALSLNATARYQVFEVSVTVTDNGISATTRKTLSRWNSYVIDRDDHQTLRPPVYAPREFEESGGSLSAQYALINLESHDIRLDRRYVEHIPCNPDQAALVQPFQAVAVIVPANNYVVGTENISLASIPPGICRVGLHLRGLDGSRVVQVDQYLTISSRRAWTAVTSPAASALFLKIRDNGWATNPDRISHTDLARLVLEGRITRVEVEDAFRDMGAVPQLSGEECEPGSAHPSNPNLTCQRTDMPMRVAGGPEVTNASKGDLLLVASCGLVQSALRDVQPQQLYTHEGIMTRHRTQITHVTLAEKRLAAPQYLEGLAGILGPKQSILKWGEPGAETMNIHQAFHGHSYVDDAGVDDWIAHFSPDPLQCPGDTALIKPKVVRPPVDAPASVREKLMIAADKALELVAERPHYRLFAFTEGNIPWKSEFAHQGRPAAVSSVFLWWAIKRAEWDEGVSIPLEGCRLDRSGPLPQWSCSPGDIEPGEFSRNGAEVDGKSWDGIYLYRADERKLGLEAIRTFVKRATYDENGWLAKFFGADTHFSNKVVNCFAYDVCAEDTACGACSSPSCCTQQELRVKQTDPDAGARIECATSCNWDYDLIHRGATEGHTVSPDDFLKWDRPAGTMGASPGENGVYGTSEELDYDDVLMRWRYEWRPSAGFGDVSGHVFIEEGSCSVDDDCAANGGGVCVGSVCRRPAANVEVLFPELGPRQARPTDEQGFYEYLTAPSGLYVLSARVHVDAGDGVRVYQGDTTVAIPSGGAIANQDIVLKRKANESERLIEIRGTTELVDCDCGTRNETRTYDLRGFCRVSPNKRVDFYERPKTELCADEVGLDFEMRCELAPDDRTVHIELRGTLFEGISDTCGGSEREDSFAKLDIDAPAGDPPTTVPVAIERLLHKDWCYYGLWAQRCDDKAFFRNIAITNRVAEL